MVNQKKINEVEDLIESLKQSKNFVLIKFERTGHKNLESLRFELKKVNSKLKVFKNTLLEKAINRLSQKDKIYRDLKKKFFPLKNNTAILTFGHDWNQGLSIFYQFSKKETSLAFKLSLLDGVPYDENETIRIAGLPGKNQLIAKIIGSLKKPITSLDFSMKFGMNKFIYILKSKSN